MNTNLNNTGYGEWFSSDEGLNNTNINSINELHEKINSKKTSLSALAKINTIEELSLLSNNNELDTEQPECYNAGIFSKLQYDDLKRAHTETVIPVCNNDYEKIKKFNSSDALKNYRNNQDIKPMDKDVARKKLNDTYDRLDHKNTELAYKLTKQAEESEKNNTKLWNIIRRLK